MTGWERRVIRGHHGGDWRGRSRVRDLLPGANMAILGINLGVQVQMVTSEWVGSTRFGVWNGVACGGGVTVTEGVGSREQWKVQSLRSSNTAISLDHVENVRISEWHYALEKAAVFNSYSISSKAWNSCLAWPKPTLSHFEDQLWWRQDSRHFHKERPQQCRKQGSWHSSMNVSCSILSQKSLTLLLTCNYILV